MKTSDGTTKTGVLNKDLLITDNSRLVFMWIAIAFTAWLMAINTFSEIVLLEKRSKENRIQLGTPEYTCLYYKANCCEISAACRLYRGKWKQLQKKLGLHSGS